MHFFLALLYVTVLYFLYVAKSLVLCLIPRSLRWKKNISGRIVLITGAGSGLGRQLAIEFSKYSVCLALVDINRNSLLETEKLLDRRSTVFTYDCDVTDYKKVYEMAKKVKKDAGDVGILVNNAGFVSGKCLMDLPEEKVRATMEVNTISHFWMCKAFLPGMMKKNWGHVVSISSIAGKMAGPKVTDYCASKFAAVGFAEALEMELVHKKLDGIKVTVVYPAQIDTGMFSGAKLVFDTLKPEYVAEEIIAGVLENKERIFIPQYLELLFILKEFAPRFLSVTWQNLSGNMACMDNFTGRMQNGNEEARND